MTIKMQQFIKKFKAQHKHVLNYIKGLIYIYIYIRVYKSDICCQSVKRSLYLMSKRKKETVSPLKKTFIAFAWLASSKISINYIFPSYSFTHEQHKFLP